MSELNDLIKKRLNSLGLSKAVQAVYVVSCAQKVANGRFTARSFRGGTLTVSCPSAILATKLRYDENKIVFEINQVLQNSIVQTLRIVVKKPV